MSHPMSPETPIDDYFVFVRRVLRNLGERVGQADVEALAEMVKLRGELETHITTAVAALRHDPEYPASWRDIGYAFAISPQAAQQRYGHLGGVRRHGGQPTNWR